MKLYTVPQFHPEQAREIADFDETRFETINKFMDSMDDDEYDAFVDANGSEMDYYVAIRMFYGMYKDFYKGAMTVADSYNAEDKTIAVYVHDLKRYRTHVELYNRLHQH